MSNQFSRELLKVVLAQWCKGIGFKAIQQSACDALIDILELYIEEIGYSSHTYAEHSSRTESNFNDLRLAFEDIGVDLQDLQNFAVNAEEIPFCKPVPNFPLTKTTTTDANGNANANNDNDKDKVETLSNSEPSTLSSNSHIPPFLPSLPSHHTYISTPIFGKVITDPAQIRRERTKQRRQIEQSLVKLSETAHVPPVKDYEATKQKSIKNPYLKTPQSTTSTSTKPSTIKTFNTSYTNTSIRPTPLDNPEIFDQFVTENDDGVKPNNEFDEEEKNVRRLDGMEEGERAKKRQKALHILSLDHRDGKIPESLIDRETRDNNNNNNNNNIFNNNSNEGPQRVTETI